MMGQSALRLLDEGQGFLWNGRRGSVGQLRPDGYLIHWAAYRDVLRGETLTETSSMRGWEEVATADSCGLLQIDLPDTMAKGAVIPRFDRSSEEERRMAWRRAFVRAADQLISAGQLVHRRRAFEAEFEAIVGLGERLFKVWQHQSKGARQRRGGAVQDLGVTLEPPVSGAYLHHLYTRWKKLGDPIPYDSYRRSGRRGSRQCAEAEAFMQELIFTRLYEERPSYSSIIDTVQSAFKERNKTIVPGQSDEVVWAVPVLSGNTLRN